MYVRFPLSLRNVEDLLFERGIDLCHETVRLWWNRFAADIRRQRVSRMRGFRHWRWHLDEVFVKINGELHYLWRAVDHEGEVLESYVTKKQDKSAALRFMKKVLKRHSKAEAVVSDAGYLIRRLPHPRSWLGFGMIPRIIRPLMSDSGQASPAGRQLQDIPKSFGKFGILEFRETCRNSATVSLFFHYFSGSPCDCSFVGRRQLSCRMPSLT